MFRGSQLLGKANAIRNAQGEDRPLPVALVLSDNSVETATLRPIIEKAKFQVVEVAATSNAINLALKHSARLVVSAMTLGGENTYPVWQNLRQRPEMAGTAFVFIMGPGETPDKLLAFESFASDYVQRPVDPSEFERRLNAVLRNSEIRTGRRGDGQPGGLSALTDFAQLRPLTPNLPTPHLPDPTAVRASPHPSPAPRVTPPVPAASDDLRARLLDRFQARIPSTAAEGPESPVFPNRVRESSLLRGEPAAAPSFLSPGATAGREPVPAFGQAEAGPGHDSPVAPSTAQEAAIALYKEASAFVLASIRRAEAGQPVEASRGMGLASRLADSLREGNGLLLLVTDRTVDFSLTQSSVNVAVLSCRIAQTLGFPEEKTTRVILAALLHDIGIVRLPKDFIHKPGSFSESERSAVEQVPKYSSEILSGLPDFEWLPRIVALTGERGLQAAQKGREFSEEAGILGVATIFEACIHRRPNRAAMTGYQALEALTTQGHGFPDRIVKAMIRSFSVYPYNEYVVLNTGEIGQVVDINPANPLRPTVRLLYAADSEPVREPKIINLAQNSSIHIVKAVTVQELP